LAQCKTVLPPTPESDLYFGNFPGVPANSGFLINLPPGSKVTVCEDYQDEAKRAVLAWAAAIGRETQLIVTKGCQADADRKYYVYQRNRSAAACRQAYPSYTPGAFSRTTTTGGQIYICHPNTDRMIFQTLLHEFGHNWGMCDQYQGGAACDVYHRTTYLSQHKSVMGCSYADHLEQDDLAGIRYMANRQDIPVNKIWSEALATGRTEPVSSETPPQNVATPTGTDADADGDGAPDGEDRCRDTPPGSWIHPKGPYYGCAPKQFLDQ
jgi:hypothetical protein